MAVEVISQHPVYTQETTCTKCGYHLRYTGEDVTTVKDYEGDIVNRYIICPRQACGEKVTVREFRVSR